MQKMAPGVTTLTDVIGGVHGVKCPGGVGAILIIAQFMNICHKQSIFSRVWQIGMSHEEGNPKLCSLENINKCLY